MADARRTAGRGKRRTERRAFHYAAPAALLVFCVLLACAFWPESEPSPNRTVPPVASTSSSGRRRGPVGAVVPDPALPPEAPELARLHEAVERLRPLHRPLDPPRPGDWLVSHPEPGQTFRQYLACRPTRARGERNRLYIQPLGEFTPARRRIVELTARYMGIYFALPVDICEDLPLSLVPASARRVHPSWGDRQLLTSYILDEVLLPRLPAAAAAYIAFTASDLWPGEGWNFVFGQATLRERVAVWSIYRFGDPDAGESQRATCLLRTMKIATHETGHMFSMHHCIAYRCNMCGSNHLGETDRQPPWLCPECMAKVSWATRADPIERYRKLEAFCRAQGLRKAAEFFKASAEELSGR